jgi:hypothetical protein
MELISVDDSLFSQFFLWIIGTASPNPKTSNSKKRVCYGSEIGI